MIDELLEELEETWSLTSETIHDIREKMATYAVSATMDSKVFREAETICKEAGAD